MCCVCRGFNLCTWQVSVREGFARLGAKKTQNVHGAGPNLETHIPGSMRTQAYFEVTDLHGVCDSSLL